MTGLTRWDPIPELVRLSDQLNRMVWQGGLGRQFGEKEGLRGSWMPAVDIRETKEAIEVTVEVPGVDPENVDVSVEGHVITIRGERRRKEIRQYQMVHRVEREYGVFERSFSLPPSADPENIEARYKDSLLTLTLPKRDEAKPKTLKINVEK